MASEPVTITFVNASTFSADIHLEGNGNPSQFTLTAVSPGEQGRFEIYPTDHPPFVSTVIVSAGATPAAAESTPITRSGQLRIEDSGVVPSRTTPPIKLQFTPFVR